MVESTSDSERAHVRSDEEWKERVKAEDRQRDAQAGAADVKPQPPPADPFQNLPRADFSILVQMFSTQAMVALGFIPEPQSGQTVRRLPLARHFIDLLGILEEKTKGNLTSDEQRLLESSLHELRLAYIELCRRVE